MSLNIVVFILAFILAIASAFYGSMLACLAIVAWGAALYFFHEVATDRKGLFHANVAVAGLGLVLSAYFGILMGRPVFAAMMAILTVAAVLMSLHLRRLAIA